MAHKVAIAAVTKLESSMKIVTDYNYGDKSKPGVLNEVSTNRYYFKFDYSIWFTDRQKDINFEIEEKFYVNTNHCTKVNCRGIELEDKPRVENYIKDLMKGIKIEPRISFKELKP